MKDELVNLTKLFITASGTGAVTSPVFRVFNFYIQQPVWGVPVTVFGAAATGAALSLFFGDPVRTRRSLFGQVAAATVFGAGAAVLVADAMNLEWASRNISMFALVSAAMIRWFLQPAIDRGIVLIKDFRFSLTKRNGDGP